MKKIFFLLYTCLLLTASGSAQKSEVIIDADTGNEIDDILAIALALKADNLNIIGLTAEQWKYNQVCHVNTMERSWELNNEILRLLNREEIPSLKGSERIVGSPGGGNEPRKSEASAFIIKKALAMPEGEKLIIICIGAVTNVASAVRLKPEIVDKIIVYSIGTFYHFDKNAWDKNEFNVRNDLNAFDVLLNTKGLELHVMPANVARPLVFTREETLPRLLDKDGIEGLIYRRWHEVVKEKESWIMWDIGLIQALIHPEWAKQKTVPSPPENISRKIYLYTHIEVETMKNDFWKRLKK